MILFNNKEILVGGKPIFISEWFNSNILFIQDLLNSNGQFMTYQEFTNKFPCKTNFLQFYQVVSAIPKHLVTKAKNTVPPERELYIANSPFFQLDDLTAIHLGNTQNYILFKISALGTDKIFLKLQLRYSYKIYMLTKNTSPQKCIPARGVWHVVGGNDRAITVIFHL